MTPEELRSLHAQLEDLLGSSHHYERQIAIIQAIAVVELAATMTQMNETLTEIRHILAGIRELQLK